MIITARVSNSQGANAVTLSTNGHEHGLDVPPRATGFGSSVNGGELLFLALATCYCNDVYREAARRGIQVQQVTVEVEGEFGAEGEPGRNLTYHAHVTAAGSETEIRDLLAHVDRVAEIHNTLRSATPVTLKTVDVTVV